MNQIFRYETLYDYPRFFSLVGSRQAFWLAPRSFRAGYSRTHSAMTFADLRCAYCGEVRLGHATNDDNLSEVGDRSRVDG